MRHNPGYGIMTKLVQGGAIPVDLFAERLTRRHLHDILIGCIIGDRSSDPKVSAAGRDQRFGTRHDVGFGWQSRRCRHRLGQSLALVDIEHGEALEKRNGPRVAILVMGPGLFALGCEAIGITNGHAFLATFDGPASQLRLPKGKPALRTEPTVDHGSPQYEHVNS
jgi:hypothetical protein